MVQGGQQCRGGLLDEVSGWKALLQSAQRVIHVVAEIEVDQAVSGLGDQSMAIAAYAIVPGQWLCMIVGFMQARTGGGGGLCHGSCQWMQPVFDRISDRLRVIFLHIVQPTTAIGNIQIGDLIQQPANARRAEHGPGAKPQ